MNTIKQNTIFDDILALQVKAYDSFGILSGDVIGDGRPWQDVADDTAKTLDLLAAKLRAARHHGMGYFMSVDDSNDDLLDKPAE